MLLLIDNYDSFTYNLVQVFSQMGEEVKVFRNDQVTLDQVVELKPGAIVISPGPSTPEKAGIVLDLIMRCSGTLPILGVCLGHQAIGRAFGAKLVRAAKVMHGKTSPIIHDGKTIFRSVPSPFEAARYHSLVLERGSIPEWLEISAQTPEGEVMGIRHKKYLIEGVQFHPESVLTPKGKRILKNFLELAKRRRQCHGS